MDAKQLHNPSIVIDVTCPLAKDPKYIEWWREGGATAIAPTVTGMAGNARSGFALIGGWHRYIGERDDALLLSSAPRPRIRLISSCTAKARRSLKKS